MKALMLGDCHFPFAHDRAIEWAISVAKELQPDLIIQMGDLFDLYAHSRFPRSQNLMTPATEVKTGRSEAVDMWRKLVRACPKAKCVQMRGNHDSRPHLRLLEKSPELDGFADFRTIWEFESVKTMHDTRKPFEWNGILFEHGYTGHGKHALHNKQSTVVGHTHRGGVVFYRFRNQIYYELNVGFLGDDKSLPLSYTPNKFNNWTVGVGVIDHLGPRFIPYPGKR